jgi:hypothetical protein
VVRYEFQPAADSGTSNGIFYVYDSHYKSGAASTSDDGTTDGAMRNGEAQIIRNDEAANLPAAAAVLYVGDFNGGGTNEAAYQTITAAKSPGGVSQGAGLDPLNPTDNYNTTWGSSTVGILTESDTKLEYRDDLQVMTANVYNDSTGTLDYVQGSFHAFGNNGTTSYEGNTNSGANTSLNDIVGNGSLTTAQVFAAMNKSIGSDHLPVVADYTITTTPNGIWTGGTNNWSNALFWSNGVVPNSSTLEVKIDSGNPIASIVTLNQNAAVEDIQLDANDKLVIASGNSMTLSGPNTTLFNGTVSNAGTLNAANISVSSTGSFTLAATGAIKVTGSFNNTGTALFSGTQTWAAGSSFNSIGAATFSTDTGAGGANLPVSVLAGTVTFASTQHLASLNISSGATVQLTSQTATSVLVVPSITDAGTLDLTNGVFDAPGASLSAITALVKKGYNATGGHLWTGTGITSSTAAGDTTGLTALGVIQNNQSGTDIYSSSHTLDGIAPGSADTLVKYTYYGDTNFDGIVNGTDYTNIDNGCLNQLTGWFNGDFNYDGVIDGSDYTLIDNTFNSQGAAFTAQIASPTTQIDYSIGTVAVPEPASLTLLPVGSLLLRRRRGSAWRVRT